MTEWTVNNKLNDWYRKQYHIKLPKNYETKSRLYFTAAYSPFELFSTGSVGLWLDPSDVANLTWRRNLLTFSESFDNAIWSKGRTTVSPNTAVAPDGTSTADTLETVSGASAGEQYIRVSAFPTTANTFSVYVKKSNWRYVSVRLFNYSIFDLDTGAWTLTGAGETVSSLNVGNGWYRLSTTSATTGSAVPSVGLNESGTTTVWNTPVNGTSAYIWGAQLELGSVATDYQRISDVNTEVIERFPSATMYQDAAGTTAVTTPGQPVGLRLDKSKGLVLGAELVTNGDFANGSTGWTLGALWTVSDAQLVGSNVASGTYATSSSFTVVTGTFYRVSLTTTVTSGSFSVRFDNGGTETVLGTVSTSGSHTFYVAAPDASSVVGLRALASGFTGTVDNISVRELAGNHATQSVLASRPVYGIEPAGGRRNLLTYTEDQTNAIWSKSLVTVTANAILAPDGISTTDTIIPSTATDFHYLAYAATVVSTTSYVVSFYAKDGGYGFVRYYDGVANNAVYTLAGAGAVTGSTGGAATITSVGDGWYRCTKTVVTASTTQNIFLYPQNVVGSVAYAGNGTSGVYIWGAQLELGSTATPYQRVTTAFDVTEAGVQTCHYVQYDGSDDGMITNSIDFTATDKMSVFAGVKKTTGNNNAVVIESSAAWPTNAGSFAVIANDGSIENYGAKANFTTLTSYRATRVGSTTDVVSLVWNFSATSSELSTQLAMKLNGESQSVVGAGGTAAPFGNHKLNLGRRGNDQTTPSLPLNGRDYGIVVVGKATTADEITSTERWLSGKTGFYAPIITGVPTIGVS